MGYTELAAGCARDVRLVYSIPEAINGFLGSYS